METTLPTMGRTLERLYLDGRARLIELVVDAGSGDGDHGATPVPACPGWTVHDVLAHLTGLCADVVTGNLAGVATDGWTAAQVTARKGMSIADIVAEWDDVAVPLAAMIDDFPAPYGPQVIADLTIHEHDLRGALDRPGERSSDAVGFALDFLMTIMEPAAAERGLGPLEVIAGDRSWSVGGAAEAVGPRVRLTISPFELFRAATGRRSPQQIRGYDWTGDPQPFIPLFSEGPFVLRASDLDE